MLTRLHTLLPAIRNPQILHRAIPTSPLLFQKRKPILCVCSHNSAPMSTSNSKFITAYAKSDRSTCKQCSEKIAKNSPRLGVVSKGSGHDETRWHHLKCLPAAAAKVGKPEAIKGFHLLKPDDQEALKKLMSGCAKSSDEKPDDDEENEPEEITSKNRKVTKDGEDLESEEGERDLKKKKKADDDEENEVEEMTSKKRKVTKAGEGLKSEEGERNLKKKKKADDDEENEAKEMTSKTRKVTKAGEDLESEEGERNRKEKKKADDDEENEAEEMNSKKRKVTKAGEGLESEEGERNLKKKKLEAPDDGVVQKISFSASYVKSKYKDATLSPNWKAFQTLIFLERVDGLVDSNKIAAFDFDGCLANTSVKRIGESAWSLMYPSIPEKLKSLYDDGFKLVIFTNESNIERWTKKRQVAVDSKLGRLNNFIKRVKVPIQVFVACGLSKPGGGKAADPFRKPQPGMWRIMEQHFNSGISIDMDQSFYVGDAAGRQGDHSDADIKFALAVGLKFYVPEEYFKKPQ